MTNNQLTQHKLKIDPEYFAPVVAGVKRAELRKNDRNYQAGDTLTLCEWKDDAFTGAFVSVDVTHVCELPAVPGYALLSFELQEHRKAAESVGGDELDQMIWKLERDGMTPKMLSLMRELREVRRAKGEPVAWLLSGGGAKNDVRFDSSNAYADPLREVTPLYAAPQLPQPAVLSVSEGVLKSLLPDVEKSEFWFEHNGKIFFEGVRFNNAVFEACRAAMLQSFGNSEQLIKHQSSNQDSDSNASGAEIKQPSSNCTIGVQAFIDAMIQDEDVSLTYEGEMPRFRRNSPVIPDGWQLVPKEPTEAMNKAGWAAINEHDAINPTYRSMLAAAPQQEVKSALEHGMQRYAGAMQKLSEGDK